MRACGWSVVRLVQAAQDQGRLRPGVQPQDVTLVARAMVYGLARVWENRHFPEWKEERPATEATECALDLFLDSVTVG